ncbi:MAG: hypothetical protein IIA67_04655 [Planctomycetes bacterium]|nr:hypothetical protein [Planctomycetota bacterium]
MARVFDPYARWLGIAPEEQPPNHYRLLAIDRDEQDAQVIREAADGRMDQLNAFESDDRPELIDRLLGEITRAHDTLSDPHARAKYDRGLHAEERLAEKRAASDSEAPASAAVGHLIQDDDEPAAAGRATEDASPAGGGFMGIDITESSSSTRTRRSGGRRSSARSSSARSSSARRAGRDGDGEAASGRGSDKGDQTMRNVAIVAGIGGGLLLLCIIVIAAVSGGSGEKKKTTQLQDVKTTKKRQRRSGYVPQSARDRAKMDAPTTGAALESQRKIGDFMDVLKTGTLDAKIQACAALGMIGFEARGARDDLIVAARGDSSPQVRQAAAAAIGKIDAATRKRGVPIPKPFTPPSPATDKAPPSAKPPVKEPSKPKAKPPTKEPPTKEPPAKQQPSKPLPVPDFDP